MFIYTYFLYRSMKNKIILASILAVLVGVVLVCAKMTGSNSGNKGNYDVSLNIYKGWNLVLASPLLGSDYNTISQDSDIKQSDIKAVFYYFRNENKYLQMYPNRQEIDNYLRNAREKPDEAFYFMQSSVWIYSEKAGVLKYSKTDFPIPNNPSLTSGWNFITMSPDMSGVYFKDLKGNCNIQKIASYQGDSWRVTDSADANKNIDAVIMDDTQNIGMGLAIKVSDDCKMGTAGSNVINPPNLP